MFTEVAKDLNERWVGREDTIDALLLAVVAGEHVLVTGPPGTGKSHLVADVFSRFPWLSRFETALTEHTDPDEILGRTAINRIKEGDWTRDVTGRLPGVHLAFVDEITRGGQALLDEFLPVMQERRYKNDGKWQPAPLRSFVAASNHRLDEASELPRWFDALDDRFLLQVSVGYVAPLEMAKLVSIAVAGSNSRISETTVCPDKFQETTTTVPAVGVPDNIAGQFIQIQKLIADLGVEISDRRWMQAIKILRTAAAIEGRTLVEVADFWSLRHVLITSQCSKPAEIRHALQTIANPHGELVVEVISTLDRIEKIIPGIRATDLDKRTEWATVAQSDLRGAIRKLKSSSLTEQQQAPHLNRAERLRRQIVDDVLGLGLESIQF